MSNINDIEPTMIGGSRTTAQLVIQQGPWSGKRFSLNQPSLIIGRAPECDIVLDDKEVSRRNSRVFWRSSQLMIEDLGSSNGTLLNGAPIVGAHPINPGDQIEIGASIMEAQGLYQVVAARQEVVIPPRPAAIPAARSAQASKNSQAVWLIVGGIIAILIVLAFLGAAAFWILSPGQPDTPPQVTFIAPPNGAELPVNVPVIVQVSITDNQGVARAELWADGVQVGQQISALPQGDPVMLVNLSWTPATPGSHVLEIRAFDAGSQQSAPALVTVNAAELVAQVDVTSTPEIIATPTLEPTPTPTIVVSEGAILTVTPTFTPEPTVAPEASLRALAGVNVRSGPGTNYSTLGALAVDQQVKPLGRSPDGGWWQIVYPPNTGGVGWVSGAYVQPNETALGLPIVTAPPPPPTNTPQPTATPNATPTSRPTATVTQPPPPADINFTADDTTLDAGECTYLRWQVRNIKAYWVDGIPGIGDEGSKKVCDPPGTTTHILKVQKTDDSTKEYAVVITVEGGTVPKPKLISPENDKEFDYYPREVTFVWEGVSAPGTVTYSIEIQYDSGSWNEWRKVNGLSGTTYTMDNFVGANPGRWRVWATSSTLGDGEKTDWRYFEFLQ